LSNLSVQIKNKAWAPNEEAKRKATTDRFLKSEARKKDEFATKTGLEQQRIQVSRERASQPKAVNLSSAVSNDPLTRNLKAELATVERDIKGHNERIKVITSKFDAEAKKDVPNEQILDSLEIQLRRVKADRDARLVKRRAQLEQSIKVRERELATASTRRGTDPLIPQTMNLAPASLSGPIGR
jgi:hypothetical protein